MSTRPGASTARFDALHALRDANRRLQQHQLRLATGRQLNSASDDPALLSRVATLTARREVLDQVSANIGDAGQLLSTADAGLDGIRGLLVDMRSRVVQAANDTLDDDARRAIATELGHLRDEIGAIVGEVQWNGVPLLDIEATLQFQTGETSQTSLELDAYGVDELGMTALGTLTPADRIDSSNAQDFLDEIDAASARVTSGLIDIGSLSRRLDIKDRTVSTRLSNVDAALSRIADTDMAAQQLGMIQAQVVQRAALAALQAQNENTGAVIEILA
jgi:flagellin